MAEQDGITLEEFRTLAARAGPDLTTEELEALKPMYDLYSGRASSLFEMDLDMEDLAVTFAPDWDPT